MAKKPTKTELLYNTLPNKPFMSLAQNLQDLQKKTDKRAPEDFKPRYNRKKTKYA